MSSCIRYLDPDDSTIVEHFLSFVVVPSLSQYTLALHNLDLSFIVPQGYDWAAVMSGSASGVQKHSRDLAPSAIYIHCHTHCLNLVLVDCVNSITHASEFFSLVQSLFVFMSISKAHTLFQTKKLKLHPGKQERELQDCQTLDGPVGMLLWMLLLALLILL